MNGLNVKSDSRLKGCYLFNNNRRLTVTCQPVDQTIKEKGLRCKVRDSMQNIRTSRRSVGGTHFPSSSKWRFCVKTLCRRYPSVTTVTP